MPTVPMPLFSRVYKNTDGSVLNDDAAVQYNGFLDELGGLSIRPGEVLAINTGDRNDGLYMWPDKNYIVCVDNGNATLRSVSGQTLTTTHGTGAVDVLPGNLTIFCNDSNYVFMAGGAKISYMDDSGTIAEIADTDAPTTVTHVAYLDGYILAINGDNKFYWSNIPVTTDWDALDFASAEANPDNTVGLYVVQRQVYLLGAVTTEIWENDGTTPFSRIPGGLIETGCAAKYSPIKYGDSLLWINQDWEVVQFTGTQFKKISGRYDQEIQSFTTVSDCIGGLVKKDGQTYCVFQFPTENRTLVYDPALEDWSEWGVWDSNAGEWISYDFRASARDINTGQTFIGKERAGVIACLDSNSRVDMTGAATSEPFKFLRQTGFIDNGSSQKKRLEKLAFRAKRGADGLTTNPKLMLRYRNNGSSQWSNTREIDLGAVGETSHQIKLFRLGIYESRQFEISATDDMSIVLSNAEADITVLR